MNHQSRAILDPCIMQCMLVYDVTFEINSEIDKLAWGCYSKILLMEKINKAK